MSPSVAAKLVIKQKYRCKQCGTMCQVDTTTLARLHMLADSSDDATKAGAPSHAAPARSSQADIASATHVPGAQPHDVHVALPADAPARADTGQADVNDQTPPISHVPPAIRGSAESVDAQQPEQHAGERIAPPGPQSCSGNRVIVTISSDENDEAEPCADGLVPGQVATHSAPHVEASAGGAEADAAAAAAAEQQRHDAQPHEPSCERKASSDQACASADDDADFDMHTLSAPPPAVQESRPPPPRRRLPPTLAHVKAESTKAEDVKAKPAKAAPIKGGGATARRVKAEPLKAEPLEAEPVKSEPIKGEPIKAELMKAEPIKAELIKAEPALEAAPTAPHPASPKSEPATAPAPAATAAVAVAAADDDEDAAPPEDTFTGYAPAKLTVGRPHPDAAIESTSLAAVPPPTVTHELAIQARFQHSCSCSTRECLRVAHEAVQHTRAD